MQTKITIADDHHLIVSSIRTMLLHSGRYHICGAFHSGADLLHGLEQQQPEILILDYHLPDSNAFSLTRQIRYRFPEIKILVLTGFDKPGLCKNMLANGCLGYLLKTSTNEDTLMDALQTIEKGKVYLDKSIKEDIDHDIRHTEKYHYQLTSREMEVLRCIVEEMSSQKIAQHLYISKKTVDKHRASILLKTGAKTPWGLMKLALELKLV